MEINPDLDPIDTTGSIKIGSNNVSKFYVGSTEVDKIYLGSNEIYNKAGDTPDIYTLNVSENGLLWYSDEITLPYNISENDTVIYKIEKDTDETIRVTYKPDTDNTTSILSVGQNTTMTADGHRYSVTYSARRLIEYDKSLI